jgi:hypothetical protein
LKRILQDVEQCIPTENIWPIWSTILAGPWQTNQSC